MSNNPHKHHFIPECYLSPFTNSKRKLWKKNNKTSRIDHVSPAQVGYEIDSNKIRTKNAILFENLTDEYFIEKESFKTQENNYGKTVRKVIKYHRNCAVIEKSKYNLFLETLITIKRRNPLSRNEIINAFQESINQPDYTTQFRTFLIEEIGEKNLPENVDSYIKSYLNNEASNPDHLYDMYLSAYHNKTYTTIKQLNDDLYSLKQYILHAPVGSQFITSDNPGYTIVNNQVLGLGGFGDAFTFFFPLSPTACLFLNSKDKEINDNIEKLIYPLLSEKSQVRLINEWTKRVSDKFVFALDKKAFEV